MFNSKEVNLTTKYLAVWTSCHINRCRFNWVQLYFLFQRTKNLAFQRQLFHSMDAETEVPYSGQILGFSRYNTVYNSIKIRIWTQLQC
jgi:hypothetical protein